MTVGDTRVITTSRAKTLLLCLGAIAFSGLGAWLMENASTQTRLVVGWAALVLFGFAGVLAALQLVWPSRLVLDGEGVAFHYLFATYRRRWIDIDRIDVVQIRATRIVTLIAKPGGKDLALGGAWSVSVDELVALIQTYLGRTGAT